MTTNQKTQIAQEVGKMAGKLSQKRIAIKAGVSAATINHMINGDWTLIKDEMFRKVQVALKIDMDWVHADTENYNNLMTLLDATKNCALSIAISMKEGRSKSHTYKRFERDNENVIYVECKNYWSKKTYVQALLRAAGMQSEGTIGELIENFVDFMRTLKQPTIIIDQADKLKDPQLDLFMDLYNDLEGHCSFVLSGVLALKKRIMLGVQRDKVGYRELYSRVGRKFISLPDPSLGDVQQVCKCNGVEDEDQIVEIFNSSEGDMRRVRREIERSRLLNESKAA